MSVDAPAARPKLILQRMTKRYANGEGVSDIDLAVYEGELVSLLGPSGCGKTTILRVIGGFLAPDAGEVVLDGTPVTNLPPEKRPTAMVFQSYNLWPHMTVFDNLAFGLRLRKTPRPRIRDEVDAMLTLVRMEGTQKKYPSQLSGGQQQRVAIARALLLKPAVLLLDEPFSALDAKIRAQMREELKKIQLALNGTIVFVTHDQEEAMAISDRIVVMNHGGFEQVGSPADIYDHPRTAFVAGFIGEMNFLESDDRKCLLAVRPEDVRISANGGGERPGTIETVVIMGHFVRVTIRADAGPVTAVLPREQAAGLAQNRSVTFSIATYHEFPR